MLLPAPPTTAPTPKGRALPTQEAPPRVANCRTNAVLRRSTSGPTAARGRVLVTISPQEPERVVPRPAAWRASCETRSTPSFPSMRASTRARARSGSSTATPCTSATDCAYSAVASRNPRVSTPLSARVTPVPMPGTTAVAPTAAPPVVTAAR
ncbi:hypothetical protein HR12_20615 [Microbacterium sp. SUBG005]|nr:hypothetical protein HR12_20615 [Microbacterium sp. SUBG005]